MTNQTLEEKYYPICWRIHNDEIEITDRNNNPIWGLNSPHIEYHKNREDYKKIHKLERNFIEEQIQSELKFSGEIISI
tara:strand:+ start:1130 stop:1363 length:234 start_codon:yes stop_codon:yes gene_type:complete